MKNLVISSLLLICTSGAMGQATPSNLEGDNNKLIQVSTINALIKGVLEGDMPMGELNKMGNFGIGTLNRLDGEMVTLDGETFQIKGDGKVNPVPDSTKTPFASMTNFKADETFEVKNVTDFAQLQEMLDEKLPSENLFYAVKVTGQFAKLKVRSVYEQKRPFRSLTEIVKEQSIFEFTDTSGTLVGFRCPDYVQGVNVAGYHMHYISDDKKQGGHVLDVTLADGVAQVDNLTDFRMILPKEADFLKVDISEKGEEAIHKVEKLMGDPAKTE